MSNTFRMIAPAMAAMLALVLLWAGQSFAIAITAAVALLCVLWWITEAVPIAVTALVPLAVFQLSAVLDKQAIASAYGSPIILLLLGGFILSKAMESSGAHKRLALYMIRAFGGGSARALVMAFMATSAFLSMWISNTATTLMLLPIAVAILDKLETPSIALPLMLGIAWAASIGGMGTPIGTPPNLIFMQVFEEYSGTAISFVDWMLIALPIVALLLPLAGLWLTRNLNQRLHIDMPAMGQWQPAEKRVLMVFSITALLWVSRQEPFGGWSHWLHLPSANDASVALLAVVSLFLISSGKEDGSRLLNWQQAQSIPWGVLLLFGGGICLAKAFVASGLSALIGEYLSVFTALPLIFMMLLLCLAVSFLTETTSNTASTVLLMPILASTAIAAEMNPTWMMLPAVFSASCAFMLPVATAPNSIVFASGHVSIQQMAQQGWVMNIIAALLISLGCYVSLVIL